MSPHSPIDSLLQILRWRPAGGEQPSSGVSRPSLGVCSKGAILVLGIMLGAMLVSILFHIASVGQAILWREMGQDAADAVAYEAALWNARGMNVIVALNIFMALLMSILMFWRLIMLVLVVMMGLSYVACLASVFVPVLGVLCRMAPTLTRTVSRMYKFDQRVSPRVFKAIGLLHRGQVIVASATPIISAVKSSTHVMNDDQYNVELALGLGVQLAPSFVLPPSPEMQDSGTPLPCGVKKRKSPAEQSGKILGKPVSLPMQHSFETDELCGKGAELQPVIVNFVVARVASSLGFPEFELVNTDAKWIKIWGFIAEVLSPVLCEDLEGVVDERVEEVIDEVCKKKKGSERDKCEEEMRAEEDKNRKESGGSKRAKGKAGGIDAESVLWSKVYWLAGNGDLFFQSWGLVSAPRPDMAETDRLISFSNRFGGEAKLTEVEQEAWLVANAEMFFDTTEGWANARYSAPWAMNWRARLRRFHDPLEYAAQTVERGVIETLWANVDRVLASGPLGNMINRVTGGTALAGTKPGAWGGAHLHNFVLSMARDELVERGRGQSYDKGFRSAAAWATEKIGAGKNDIIH